VQDVRILVHTKGSLGDPHVAKAATRAVKTARIAGFKAVEAIESITEAKRRLKLPATDPQKVDVVVSAYNTQRLLAVASDLDPLLLRDPETGKIEPLPVPLTAILPSMNERYPFVLSDAGAQLNPKPYQVYVSALLAGNLYKVVMGKQNPYHRFGLLSIGEEWVKLPPRLQAVGELLQAKEKRVVKPAEPKDVYKGDFVEVLVPMDGREGNLFLKTSEGVSEAVAKVTKSEYRHGPTSALLGLLSTPVHNRVRRRFHHDETHGAYFLGTKHFLVKHHGRSNADALYLAIERAARHARNNVIGQVWALTLQELEQLHPELLPT